MNGTKMSVSLLAALCLLLSLVQVTTAAFYHLDRFNRACIRNHGCEGEVVNIKMQVENVHQCQRFCDREKKCSNFTWFSDGNFKHICFLFADCNEHDDLCDFCYSGPRSKSCPWSMRHHRSASSAAAAAAHKA